MIVNIDYDILDCIRARHGAKRLKQTHKREIIMTQKEFKLAVEEKIAEIDKRLQTETSEMMVRGLKTSRAEWTHMLTIE